MERYNPLQAPDPEEWLAFDEQEKMDLVEQYHHKARIRLPNATLHATMHTIVENQIAMGEELPVKRKLQQLIEEGLDRHEAIHAIAWILSLQMARTMKSAGRPSDASKSYFAALEDLTAENWRRCAED